MHDDAPRRRSQSPGSPDWKVASRELRRRLAIAIVFFVTLFASLVLLGAVAHDDWRALDETILLAAREVSGGPEHAPAWLSYLVRDLTALGGVTVLSLLVFAVMFYLLLRGHKRTATALFAISVSGWMLSHTLKFAVARSRPDLVPHGMTETTASFPSGHALVSMVVFVTLGSMLARVEADARVRRYLFLLPLMLSIVIGATRVLLGVHWPSDVLAGWIIGLVWVMAGMAVLDAAVRRRPPSGAR